MDFCTVCGNMLYIRTIDPAAATTEDLQDTEEEVATSTSSTIEFYCKHCNFKKVPENPHSSFVISETHFDENAQFSLMVNPFLKYDPTLPHVDNVPCPNEACSKPPDAGNDVIYIKYDNTHMKYIYYCSHCSHFWRLA